MSRPDVILSFMSYEIKRAIARRKVLALIAFTVLLDTLPYYALSTAGTTLIPGSAYPYIWVAGVFAAQPLFLNFTAILIAAGAMSEEYEQGTAELLLSKPVERNDYFAGKFLGGYTLFLTILAFNIILSVASAFTFFGSQFGLEILPGLFPSFRGPDLLLSSIHAGRASPTILTRLHLLLSSLLLQFHNQRLHGPHLHADRKNNLQDNPDLPANLSCEFPPNPVRESSSTSNGRDSSPVRRLGQRHSPNIGPVRGDSSRLHRPCYRGRRSLLLVRRHFKKDELETRADISVGCSLI